MLGDSELFFSQQKQKVCRVQNNDIDMCIYQLLCTIQNVCCDTKCSTAQQTAFGVFGRERILDLFFNILDRDQSFPTS